MRKTNGGAKIIKEKGILDQNRPLKASDFRPGELEKLTEELKIGKQTLLKEINFFLDIFKKQDWIRESNGKLLLNDIAVETIFLARSLKRGETDNVQDIQIAVLSSLVNYLAGDWQANAFKKDEFLFPYF